jgi:aminopeptidase
VQRGWQVVIVTQTGARPLIEAVLERVAARGAFPLLRMGFDWPFHRFWVKHAPEDLLTQLPSIDAFERENCDAIVTIEGPSNTRQGSDLPAERFALWREALRPYSRRVFEHELAWVVSQHPTPALAQEAGMTLAQFEDFFYGSVLIDWDALEAEMEQIAARFDAGKSVRIVGDETDLTLNLEGRNGRVSTAKTNLPSGEVFYSPLETSAEGVITFTEYPACYAGHQVGGVRLRFEGGVVVEASAASDEGFLLTTLDTDEGARRLGEFGIGCNPGIRTHTRNTLFDEKMDGTIHLALGQSYTDLGGTNESAIHWDIVKDLRNGGRIELDGEVVQENGAWKL